MTRKVHEYFTAGCRLAWSVPVNERVVRVYTGPTAVRILHEDDVLDGGAVLPEFRLVLHDWFDRAGPRRDA